MKIFVQILLLLAVAPVGLAQERPKPPTSLPGSFWVSSQTSPAERNNLITQAHSEQGLTFWRSGSNFLTPYTSVDLVVDAKGKDYNNRVLTNLGMKYSRTFRNGVIEVKGALAAEKRFKSGVTSIQPTASVGYWFGWQNPQTGDRPARFFTGFPGSSWGTVGTVSPAEKRNVIGAFSLTQGVTVVDHRKYQIIPFVELRPGFDTKGYDWNNRLQSGGGVKVAVPTSKAVIEFGMQYTDERRQQIRAHGVSAFFRIWTGWSATKGRR